MKLTLITGRTETLAAKDGSAIVTKPVFFQVELWLLACRLFRAGPGRRQGAGVFAAARICSHSPHENWSCSWLLDTGHSICPLASTEAANLLRAGEHS